MAKFLKQQVIQKQLQNATPSIILGEKILSFDEKYYDHTYDQLPEMQKTNFEFLSDIGVEVLKIENEVKKIKARKELLTFMEEKGLVSLEDIMGPNYQTIYNKNKEKLQQLLKNSGYSETITNIEETRNALLEYSPSNPEGISTKVMDDKIRELNGEKINLGDLKKDLLYQKEVLIGEKQSGEIIISNYLKPSEDGKPHTIDEKKIEKLYLDALSDDPVEQEAAFKHIIKLTGALKKADILGSYLNPNQVLLGEDNMKKEIAYMTDHLNLDCSKLEPEVEEGLMKIMQTIGAIGKGRF